jgi:DNA-binding MarR family transcriptional regulator
MINFEETILFSLHRISTTFKVLLEKSLQEVDLHSGQVFVLFELWKKDGQSQIEIANSLKISAPTVHHMVKSLAEKGFVSCQQSPDDARRIVVFLTSKGIQVRPQIEDCWEKIEKNLLVNFTDTEKLILDQLFGKLKTNLQ